MEPPKLTKRKIRRMLGKNQITALTILYGMKKNPKAINRIEYFDELSRLLKLELDEFFERWIDYLHEICDTAKWDDEMRERCIKFEENKCGTISGSWHKIIKDITQGKNAELPSEKFKKLLGIKEKKDETK